MQPSGALTTEELAGVRSLVTKEFACLLEAAAQFKHHSSRIAPSDKPPFEEGDLFTSSAFEPPLEFEIGSVQRGATTATVSTIFHAEENVTWQDNLQLRYEDGEWRVSDVQRGGAFEFGNRGSLIQQFYSTMSRDLPAASWSGQSVRACNERPKQPLEQTRQR